MSQRLQDEANGHADGLCNGCSSSSNSDGHGVTELCQNVLCNIVASENFSSLCKVLTENFEGTKPESVLDFSIINSRMKEQAYEQSPTLFLSDIQQVILGSFSIIKHKHDLDVSNQLIFNIYTFLTMTVILLLLLEIVTMENSIKNLLQLEFNLALRSPSRRSFLWTQFLFFLIHKIQWKQIRQ